MRKISKDQIGANIKIMILLILSREDSYGYSITKELNELSEGRICMKEGSLYPLLKKMEEGKMIKSHWNIKESDRPRKYYKILSNGIKELDYLLEERDLMKNMVENLQSRL